MVALLSAYMSGAQTGDSLTGPYALVAGGSKGIGYGIAEALARRQYNLVLIARGMDSLLAAKTKLETAYNIHVEVLSYDLAKETSAPEIAKWCTERNLHLKMLCNVAGYGGSTDYLTAPLDTIRYMVRLNVESAMSLTMLLLPLLEKNAPSHILNVASMAGFAPIPSKNVYSSTKSAVVTGVISVWLIKKLKIRTINGETITFPVKKFQKGQVFGGLMFGFGWALTGACPGPLFAQIGSGMTVVIITTLSAVVGTWVYGRLQHKLPH